MSETGPAALKANLAERQASDACTAQGAGIGHFSARTAKGLQRD